jgi:phosphopantothenoylcysteine decarboxylase/phosphopantothenate--cysteine ligase
MRMKQTLAGKQIVLGVTGSIAAVETVRLAHALRRRGATVSAVMSKAASGIIHPDALAYATDREVITRCTGDVEHVKFCGEGGSADLLLIAPCTANTIGKVACGIDDTPVTTFATTAIGSGIPVIIVPAMHHSMYRHPAVISNVTRLREWGIGIIEPRIEEEKAKIAGIDEIVFSCERALLGRPLGGKHVLITSGPCQEPVDEVRVLTTRSTGLMGRAIALQAYRLGADVTVVHRDRFPCVKNIRVTSAKEMRNEVISVFKNSKVDIYVSAAAISDFAPRPRAGKLRSGSPSTIDLEPLPKLIDEVMETYHPITCAFKLGGEGELKAEEMLGSGITMVVVNGPGAMGAEEGEFVLLSSGKRQVIKGNKEDVAEAIWKTLL